ncbi:GNAT family N-acetyltransferase [Listeria sp. PSOL-1]|uniref:GNAT family N-acetyltransferase n=1 Tax=Listeria sp. PSOL-1 TaxID=1844999 RepID=UPI0013D22B3A
MKQQYHIKFVNEKDIALVEEVNTKCDDYYFIEQGKSATSKDAMAFLNELPPGKAKFDQFNIAILNENEEAIGLVNVIANYPRQGQWFIGLLLLIPDVRKSGLGKVLHQVIAEWASDGGADSLMLAVLAENKEAISFWQYLGYQKHAEINKVFGDKQHLVEKYVLTL